MYIYHLLNSCTIIQPISAQFSQDLITWVAGMIRKWRPQLLRGPPFPCWILSVKPSAFIRAGASDSAGYAGKCKMDEIDSQALTGTHFAQGTKDTKFKEPFTPGTSHLRSDKT